MYVIALRNAAKEALGILDTLDECASESGGVLGPFYMRKAQETLEDVADASGVLLDDLLDEIGVRTGAYDIGGEG